MLPKSFGFGLTISEGINLPCIVNVIIIQSDSNLNEIKSDNTRATSNACWKCVEVVHFHTDCIKFRSSSQSGDSTSTVLGQMMHTLTANSFITYMVLKSLLKEQISVKVTKKSYKLKYQKVNANVASPATSLVTTGMQQ